MQTDGQDNGGGETEMLAAIPSGEDSSNAHIFSVGFGNAADLTTLRNLAAQTNGKYWSASTSSIASVYQQISYEV